MLWPCCQSISNHFHTYWAAWSPRCNIWWATDVCFLPGFTALYYCCYLLWLHAAREWRRDKYYCCLLNEWHLRSSFCFEGSILRAWIIPSAHRSSIPPQKWNCISCSGNFWFIQIAFIQIQRHSVKGDLLCFSNVPVPAQCSRRYNHLWVRWPCLLRKSLMNMTCFTIALAVCAQGSRRESCLPWRSAAVNAQSLLV